MTKRALHVAVCAVALGGCHRGGDRSGAGETDTATDGDGSEGDGDGTGTEDGADDDTGGEPGGATPSTTTRRLSAHELTLTIAALTGVAEPAGLERLPPESTGFVFDRVVNGQTISRPHLEAYMAIADSVAIALLADARLDDLASACSDEILPPPAPSSLSAVSGSSLAGAPEWAFSTSAADPTVLSSLYAPDPIVSYAQAFAAPGSYEVALSIDAGSVVDTVEIRFDGNVVATETNVSGAVVLAATLDVTGDGVTPLEFHFLTDPDDNNLAIDFLDLRIEGPIDPGAGLHDAARAACADAIIEELAPLVFRRPLTAAQRDTLSSLFTAGADDGGFVVGLKMLFEAMLASPSFLYLVEHGEPVEGREGVFALDEWELAARLSYALCESPPDAALRAAAADGTLGDVDVLADHARRLLNEPCGRATTRRFYEQWLHLDRLPELNKSPDTFPEWNDEVRAGLVAEAGAFVDELVWTEAASLQTFFGTDAAWPDPRSAFLSGVAGATAGEKVTLPDERAGILTQPAFLAVSGTFDGTSPVERGVFVLERVLCESLPPPPANEDIAPPPPDPDLTTRQRWAEHSSNPACAGCHTVIDPVGFSLEDFDGIGRHRTQENGIPIDATGGIPPLGIEDGSLVGGAELALAIASSERAAACFGEQWLRFALGRMAVDEDDATLAGLADIAESGSMSDVFVSIATSETFRYRYEGEP